MTTELLSKEQLADIEAFQVQRRKSPVAVDAWLYVAEIDRLLAHVRTLEAYLTHLWLLNTGPHCELCDEIREAIQSLPATTDDEVQR